MRVKTTIVRRYYAIGSISKYNGNLDTIIIVKRRIIENWPCKVEEAVIITIYVVLLYSMCRYW